MTDLQPLGDNPVRQVLSEMAQLKHSNTDLVKAQEHIAKRMAELTAIKKGKRNGTNT